MSDDTRWFELSARLAATSSLVDDQLRDGTTPPLYLAGGFLSATARLSERCEGLITRIGQNARAAGPGAQLDDTALEAMRNTLRHLQAARALLDDAVVPALDPDARGTHGPTIT